MFLMFYRFIARSGDAVVTLFVAFAIAVVVVVIVVC